MRRAAFQNSNGGYLPVETEDAYRAGPQHEMLPAKRAQPNPSRRKDAQNVSVREQHCIAVDGARPDDHPVDPCRHLLRRLSRRASVAENNPTRHHLTDLGRRQSLVFAIVPLDQISLGDRRITESC